jgi:carboxypeptidase D
MLLGPWRLFSFTLTALGSISGCYAIQNPAKLRERSNAALTAHMESMKASVLAQKPNGTVPGVQNITFSNPKASGALFTTRLSRDNKNVLIILFIAFFVDGKAIPLVDFDIGPSWAGLLPISGAANETRQASTSHLPNFYIPHLIYPLSNSIPYLPNSPLSSYSSGSSPLALGAA